jgi:hypothetical protein
MLRNEMIERYGGDKVAPEAVILIDGTIEALGVQKLQGLYIRKAGIIRQDSLKAGNLELHSILGKNWISYANVVRQNLLALQTLKLTNEDEGLDLKTYLEKNYPDKEEEKAGDEGSQEEARPEEKGKGDG